MGVVELADRLVAAYNDKDAEAFAALFTDDAEFVNVRGDRTRGRAGIAEGHQWAFSSVLAGTSLVKESLDVTPVTDDVELGVLGWRRERSSDAPPAGAPAGTGVFTLVARRGADAWRLAAASNVPVIAPPATPTH